jgi:hypothetical protein
MYEFTVRTIQFLLRDNMQYLHHGNELIFFMKVTCLLLESYQHTQIVGKVKLDIKEGATW